MTAMLNAADYGATGNGTTDDTSALQSALNAMKTGAVGGGPTFLLIPPGTYKVSSTLDVTFSGGSAGTNWGILGHGANLASYITTTGAPLLRIQSTNGAVIRYLL